MTFNPFNPGAANEINPYQRVNILVAQRAPTTNDIQLPGTQWEDRSVSPPVIYETVGNGIWNIGGVAQATTTTAGITRYATAGEVNAGTGTNNATLALDVFNYGQSLVLAGANIAQQTIFGLTKLAPDATAVAGTANNPGVTAFVIQPSNLAAIFASPPATGGTVPAAAVFTTIGFTTATGTAGGTWASGGTAISIGADATTDTINIGTGAAARTIHIGDSTQANLVTIGSATGAAALTLKAGSGNFTLTTGAATVITMGAAVTGGTWAIGGTAQTGTMTFGSSSGISIVAIADGAGTSTLNLANSGANNVVNVGAAMVGGTIVIGGTGQTGAITLGSSTGAGSVLIANGSGATTVAIANVQTGGSVSIGTALTTGPITIGGTAQSTGAITLGSSTAANSVLIQNGVNTGAQIVSISNGATAANSTVNILSGTGSAGAGILHMADNPRVTTITLGNIIPTAARTTTFLGGNQAVNDTFTILGGNATAGTQSMTVFNGVASGGTQTISLMNGTQSAGTQSVNILSGITTGTAAGTFNLGTAAGILITTNINTGASAHVLNIGNASSGVQTWTVGTGGFTMPGGGNTIAIAGDVATNTVNIGTGAAAANTISIGGTGANVIAIGNTQTTGSVTIGNALTSGTVSVGGTAGTGLISIGRATNVTGQTVAINNAASNTGANLVNILNGATPGASTTLNIMNGAGTAGTQTVNILASGATRAGAINLGTGIAAHVITIGQVTSSLVVNCPQTITLASGAAIGLAVDTSAGTGIAATFKSTSVTTPDVSALIGGYKAAVVTTVAGASPQTANSRHFQISFSGVSIAANAVQAFEIDNSTITGATTVILYTMIGATTGSAPVIQSIVNAAGKSTITVMNGAALTTTTANITFIGWVIN